MTYPLQLTAVDSTAYQHSILQSPQLRWPTTTFTRHASPRLEATTAAAELLDVHAWLEQRVKAALADVAESYGVPAAADSAPMVVPATRPEFGDYQCNAALPLAKPLKAKPRDIAQALLERIQVDDVFEPAEIAGPGFLNFKLRNDFMCEQLRLMLASRDRCAVPTAPSVQRCVVDYSSPNIAKEMHVGHLRSTIIGDTLARILAFRGHNVLRLNHVGDWGTQFGMLITHMRETMPAALSGDDSASVDLEDLVAFYKQAKARFDAEPEFQKTSRAEVVKLQAGDEESLAAWRMLCQKSEIAFKQVYEMLSIDENLETRGESFYNSRLPGLVEELRGAGILQESDGAQCVFLEGYTNRDGKPMPMIVQKSDGGFMYSTTDLAALQQRATEEKADRILYVTDSGQATHFAQVFEIARKANLVGEHVSLEHVPFGLVMGEDGKKFKTRSGDTVKLVALLDEALVRARADITKRLEVDGREESEAEIEKIARAVGIGAVKYADLAMNRQSNYRFSFDKMLSLNGNTAPYMLYAYARIRGIQRRAMANADGDLELDAPFLINEPTELNLARQLVYLPQVIIEVERDLLPSRLCEYIYELATRFNQFYESCPVMNAETAELKTSRLALCELTASTLRLSLELLGIDVLERL